MKGRRGRRSKQILDGLEEKREHWKLKDEALDRTVWRNRFWKMLCACRAADNIMTIMMMMMMMI